MRQFTVDPNDTDTIRAKINDHLEQAEDLEARAYHAEWPERMLQDANEHRRAAERLEETLISRLRR